MPAPTDFKNSLKLYLRLFAYLKNYRIRVILTFVCMVLSAASTDYVMYQFKPLVNGAFLHSEDPQGVFHRLVYFTVPLTFLAAIVRALSTYGQDYLNRYLGQRVVQRLRNDLYSHFLTLPMSYFNTQRTGSLASRITNDVQILQDSMISAVGQGTYSGLMVLALAGLLVFLDWQMAFMAMVVFPVALYPIFQYGRKSVRPPERGRAFYRT